MIGRDDLVHLEDRLHDLESVIDLRSSSYGGVERRTGRDRPKLLAQESASQAKQGIMTKIF